MNYARLRVKTNSGIKTKWVCYESFWKCGRYLGRYYGGKSPELYELDYAEQEAAYKMGITFQKIG